MAVAWWLFQSESIEDSNIDRINIDEVIPAVEELIEIDFHEVRGTHKEEV